MKKLFDLSEEENQNVQNLLNYIKSMAAWCCLGYIVGLGDRHLGNIMLNTKTGSVEHIDFDCLFE